MKETPSTESSVVLKTVLTAQQQWDILQTLVMCFYMWISPYLSPSGFAGMVETKTKFICKGSSEVKALRARGVQTAGAGQEKDGLVHLDIPVGIYVGPEAATQTLQPPHHSTARGTQLVCGGQRVAEEGNKMKSCAGLGS